MHIPMSTFLLFCCLLIGVSLVKAQEVPVVENVTDTGCAEEQRFNISSGECVCVGGLTINTCPGPTSGMCGLFNGAEQHL